MTGRPGELIGRGRTSDVFTYGEGRAIKLYPAHEDLAGIENERRVAELVYESGVPSVRCYGLADVDGQVGIVFDRIDGLSLTGMAERDLRLFGESCRALADCHVKMHAAPAAELTDVRELAVSLLEAPPLDTLESAEREALRAHLRSLPDGDSILHLDYHAQNVFQHHGGYAIIDWHSGCRGAAAADVAMSVLLMREAELFPGTPWLMLLLYSSLRRVMLRLYLKRYLSTSDLTTEQIEQWQTCARVLRLGLLNIESERAPLIGRIRQAIGAGLQ